MERPTFTPSVHLKINTPDMGEHYQSDLPSTVCHYFITDGKISFCGDSTHALAGKSVDLPEIPPDKYLTSQRLTSL